MNLIRTLTIALLLVSCSRDPDGESDSTTSGGTDATGETSLSAGDPSGEASDATGMTSLPMFPPVECATPDSTGGEPTTGGEPATDSGSTTGGGSSTGGGSTTGGGSSTGGEPATGTGEETSAGSGLEHWVGTWGTSPQLTEPDNEPPSPLTDNTLRQFAYVSIGGSELRIQISNEFGTGPVTLNSVHMAAVTTVPAIDTGTDVALAFSGSPSVTIPAGEAVYSDSFAFALTEQTSTAISIQFGSVPTGITGHPGSRTTSYIATGDAVASETLTGATMTDHWYYLSRIEVMAPADAGAVVALGDSITDGRGSTTNLNDRWPDALSRRLRANPATALTSVINAGIGGNAVVTGGLGPTARLRFARDVLGQAGVRWVIVLEGINDIGSANTLSPESGLTVARNIITAYEEFIDAAHSEGLLVYGVPILPMEGSTYYAPTREGARQYVNEWIRTCGRFDAVIDLDTAVADPQNPARLLPMYDSSDGLHLNPTGYQAMADAIDLSLFVP